MLSVGGGLAWSFRYVTESTTFLSTTHHHFVPKPPTPHRLLFVALLIFILVVQSSPPDQSFDSHPIDSLINNATVQSEEWAQQASTSQSLDQALVEYRRRYKRYPPPSFDNWYNFAVEKASFVIDDWDQIHHDLEPFWVRISSFISLFCSGRRAQDSS